MSYEQNLIGGSVYWHFVLILPFLSQLFYFFFFGISRTFFPRDKHLDFPTDHVYGAFKTEIKNLKKKGREPMLSVEICHFSLVLSN